MTAAVTWHSAKTAVSSTKVFMAHQVNLFIPSKTVWDDVSCSASLRSRVRDYIIYHCQLYHAPQKVKDVHLLAVTSLSFDIKTPIISSKMYLYWSGIYHQQTYIFKYNFLHFAPLLQMTLPPNGTPTVSFRNYNCCRLHAPGGDLCKLAALPVCKSSANLWSSCGSSCRLTVSLDLSTGIHLPLQWVCHLNSGKHCSLFALLLYIQMKIGAPFYRIATSTNHSLIFW